MRSIVTVVLSLLVCSAASAAVSRSIDNPGQLEGGVWSAPRGENIEVHAFHGRLPRAFRVAALDRAELHALLQRAPLERFRRIDAKTIATEVQPGLTLTLPMPDGSSTRIAIEESPIFSPELQRQHPDIRTYRGWGLDDPTLTARLDETPLGFHALLLSENGTVYIDPVRGPERELYISYWHKDIEGTPFRCLLNQDDEDQALAAARTLTPAPLTNPSGTQLRTYRLAVSATGEYTTWAGGTSQAAAQIATTMNRVTGIYEVDVAVRFNITATRIFTDASTDPFTTNDTATNRSENQTTLDANPGSANYDIGHVVSAGGTGGIAWIGAACGSQKAWGATSLGNPSGDGFDVDFVAHEMGHQMGGHHTYDGTVNGNCNGQRDAPSAYEPGSGTTIMAYAGVCGAGNVQAHSDPFFHSQSFDQIKAYSSGGGACGTLAATGNTPPNPNAGPDFTIPQGTPFTLTGSATDPNGDSLTYKWEQFDLGPGIGAPTSTYNGPVFRSFNATSSPSRTIPRMQDLLSGAATPWEVLPMINRDLDFRLTVRDNRANGGGSDYDAMVVHVNGAPFSITAPSGNLECGTSSTLNWNVGGGSGDPNVQALLSTNNGASFSTTLLASTANDGSEAFTVPQTLTNQAWIELQPIGNIYFALKGGLRIVDTTAPSVTAPGNLASIQCTQCSPQGASPAIGTAAATDVCDPTLAISNNAPAVFPLGTTTVQWSARDDSNNIGTANQTVQVVDTLPPSLTAPAPVTAECTGPSGTPVALGSPTVSDICWCSVAVTNNAPPVFGLGTTTVTWKATDGSSNSSTATQLVKIVDTTPPTLDVTVTPSSLWPVNHKLVKIHANIVTTDICDASPQVRLLSITSSEPQNDLGDGNTNADIQGAVFGTDDRDFFLRAERSGTGPGRVYTITYESRDGSGNVTIRHVTVTVAHN